MCILCVYVYMACVIYYLNFLPDYGFETLFYYIQYTTRMFHVSYGYNMKNRQKKRIRFGIVITDSACVSSLNKLAILCFIVFLCKPYGTLCLYREKGVNI